jgi:hypothetical protein
VPVNRRTFLSASVATGLAALAPRPTPARADAAKPRKPRILLRSSWQTVNIGDIAHTPGVLALLERYLPDAELWHWPTSVADGVEDLLLRRFPKLKIVKGTDALKAAFAECDFFLHGSGASLVATKDLARWVDATNKPYGVYGITISPEASAKAFELIEGARFAFFRDSVSLGVAKERAPKCPVMEFGPDGAFACDLRNDAAADAFLKEHGLEEGKFMCCIGRLRYTPYWKIRNKPMTPEDDRKHARNEEMKEQDHAPLRAAIERVVRETGMKVLVCPEDQSQMAVGKELIVDPLPPDVRKNVVWRERYWLTDEALSTYARSAGLFGNEMHSPIMCVGHEGVPAVVCRWAEQTSKGFMWRDIGLGDWLFDMDQAADRARVPETVVSIAKDAKAAREKAAGAQRFVHERQAATMKVLAAQFAK